MNRYKEICIALDRVRPEHNWLSYSISANIEVLCRKYKIFSDTYSNEFCDFLNLKYSNGKYPPCCHETRRVYYLIYRLSEYVHVEKDDKLLEKIGIPPIPIGVSLRKRYKIILKYWEGKFIEACGDPYNSQDYIDHRTGCVGSKRSKKDENFVDELNEILSKYEKSNSR